MCLFGSTGVSTDGFQSRLPEDLLGSRHYVEDTQVSRELLENSVLTVTFVGTWEIPTANTGIVGLDVCFLHFAAVDDEGVTLATVVAENGLAVEGEVEGFGELARRVAEEADARLAGRVEGFAPCGHPGEESLVSDVVFLGRGWRCMAGAKVDGSGGEGKVLGSWMNVRTYTKGSLTETTKTWPASFSFSWLA